MQDINVTLIQCELAWEDRDVNLAAFNHRLSLIEGQTDLIVLPEMFSSGFSMNSSKCAEEESGPSVEWLKKKSSELNTVMTCSMMIKEEGKLFNRLFWVRPDGTYDTYDKRHLFRFGNEHEHFSPGNKILITELKGWKFRPMVCYDLRFPVWSKNKYQNGKFEYDCLLYLANWPEKRSHHWTALLSARAIENLSYCIGVNRIGTDGRNIKYSGDSRLIESTGAIAGSCEPNKEQILTLTLSAEHLQNWRNNFNAGQDWDDFKINL
jgi:omega-amidase